MPGGKEFDLKARRRHSVAVLTGRAENGAPISSASSVGSSDHPGGGASCQSRAGENGVSPGVIHAEQDCWERFTRGISELLTQGATFRFSLSRELSLSQTERKEEEENKRG